MATVLVHFCPASMLYSSHALYVPADNFYCIVCLALPIEQVEEIPARLCQLLRLPEFKTKKARMGKVI
jgi:hypothetical protein